MLKNSIVAASIGLVGSANAFWRMECPGRVGLARVDPIVDPGVVSPHVHAIHGSSGESPTGAPDVEVRRMHVFLPCVVDVKMESGGSSGSSGMFAYAATTMHPSSLAVEELLDRNGGAKC